MAKEKAVAAEPSKPQKFHCCVDGIGPFQGVILEAADRGAAEQEYRARQGVPAHLKIRVTPFVDPMDYAQSH